MNEKVKSALEDILRRFETEDIPIAIAISAFPIPNIPAKKWNLLNRILMVLAGTNDARGIKQWNQAGRSVNKGAKAFYILAPRLQKAENQETDEEKKVLVGFLAVPVFRVEDTHGDALDYEQIKLPDLPLQQVAEKWGLAVKAIPGNPKYLGLYSSQRQEICLATEHESVFFHELAHSAHDRVSKDFSLVPVWKKEIIAEFSAAVLCRLAGKNSNLGNSYNYIQKYAEQTNLTPLRACLRLIADIETVLEEIIKAATAENL